MERVFSRLAAKPYASKNMETTIAPQLDEDGHLTFHDNDIENQKNWSKARRWYLTIVAVSMVTNATFASSAPSGCIEGIADDFGVSITAAQLTMTLFLLGYCAGPLVFAPLSEFYGRQYLFHLTFSSYTAFNFLCAFAPNFTSLLVGRFLTGTFVSSALSNSPGVLADIWHPVDRGNAMAIFSCAANIGLALGPIVAGFLQLTKSWRWCFYVLLWMAGATHLLLLTLPETFPSIILLRKARRLRLLRIPGLEKVQAPVEATDRTLVGIFKVALLRPWVILFDRISFLVAIYMSTIYMLLYMLFTIYPIVFQQRRGWNSGIGELPLLGTAIGPCIGSVVVFLSSRRNRLKVEQGHQSKPEDRLPLAMIGGVGFAITMFWFAWSAEFESVHWAVPTLAGVFLTASIMLIFVTCMNYLTDTYTMYAASAVAANTVVRSACAAAAPLFTQQMFDALGVGGGGSLIGGVAILCAIIPFAFHKYGEDMRKRSNFAKNT
ncbi:MFS transporter [Dactylonectria macrodidyma]|uniref:MFS transporter n=1 Tax=Dactylonectria macrodidyma TaxID=307937 RepID=A0A9P9EPZ1_9HYPO|nr:MFS transporter [Dactylonectria macrodidyma]